MNAKAHGLARDLADKMNQRLPPSMAPANAEGAIVTCGTDERKAVIILKGGPSLSKDILGRPADEFVLEAYQLVTEAQVLGPNEILPLLLVLMRQKFPIHWWESAAGTVPSADAITGTASGSIDPRI